ncbi:MAG TPA: zinc ribbon domain-containing protein [Blastocatellia bacterium]|nr:zinc ribbon domain-containing protein [Blastocatellia bacterium]
MYCPSCGAESTDRMKYCKHCGTNLGSPSQPGAPKRFPPWMIVFFLFTIGVITIVGLTIPLAASHDLILDGFGPGGVTNIFIGSVVTALGLDALLVWLLLRLIKIYHHADAPVQNKSAAQTAARDYSPSQIAAPPEAVGSVTEHTTRNFDKYEDMVRPRPSDRSAQ